MRSSRIIWCQGSGTDGAELVPGPGAQNLIGQPGPVEHGNTALGQLLSEQSVAERWSKSIRTLQRWRAEGYGPAYLRIGGTIHYRLEDVLAFEQAMRCGGEAGK